MVGTFKSTGCETCRKRKKKCGEELPECSACVKAGWKCPGYPNRWKFVNESQSLALLYRKKKYIFEDIGDTQQFNLACDGSSHFTGLVLKDEPSDIHAQNNLGLSLSPPFQQTCSVFCYILDQPHNGTTFPIKSHGSFYAMIPRRLGHSVALDDAISCLCSLYTDSLKRIPGVSDGSFRLYARSLRSLRKILDIPQARTAAETICASIILQTCELMMNDKGGRWDQLCQGTKLLIQESGPERFDAPFERAMLESQRAWYILQDASAGRECFLSRQNWRQLLRSSSDPGLDEEPASISLRSQLCEFLVDVPRLIRETSDIKEQILNSDVDQARLRERCESVILQIASLKEAFEWWYCTKISPLRSTLGAVQPDEVKATNNSGLRNEELLLAIVDCASNSLMIRLDMLLSSLLTSSADTLTDPSNYYSAISRRRTDMFQSLNFVRQKSLVAAIPLEFGLQQLWLDVRFGPNSRAPS